jgi:hypothetical protein
MNKSLASHSTCPPEDPLWAALSGYPIGSEGTALSFTARLARENGWTTEQAERVIEEYRRFAFLTVRAGHEVTPSDAVDQAWHLHLCYTRDYWERFCPLLGAPLHHGPTRGGAAENARFYDNYCATLRSYERLFGCPAPADLWPSASRRLLDDPRARRVHPRDGLVVSHTAIALSVLVAALAGAGISMIVMKGI